jgi:hypothetical protein
MDDDSSITDDAAPRHAIVVVSSTLEGPILKEEEVLSHDKL